MTTLLVWLLVAQPIPAGAKIGIATYLKASYNGLKGTLTASAAKMPDADYGFKPGPMPEVRTFGQLFAHVAAAQFSTCAAASGVANPVEGKDVERAGQSKAEITKLLADSFAVCDGVFNALTDASAMELVKQGQGEVVRSAALIGLLAHGAEMYGVSTVYLREKGIVPPSTERAQRR